MLQVEITLGLAFCRVGKLGHPCFWRWIISTFKENCSYEHASWEDSFMASVENGFRGGRPQDEARGELLARASFDRVLKQVSKCHDNQTVRLRLIVGAEEVERVREWNGGIMIEGKLGR